MSERSESGNVFQEKEKEHFQSMVERWRTRVCEEEKIQKANLHLPVNTINTISKVAVVPASVSRRRRRSDSSISYNCASNAQSVHFPPCSDHLETQQPRLKKRKLTKYTRRPRSISPSYRDQSLSSDSIFPRFLPPSAPTSIADISSLQAPTTSQATSAASTPFNTCLELPAVRRKLNQELEGRVIGPMLPSKFLEDLLPKPANSFWTYKKEMQDATQVIVGLRGLTSDTKLYQPLATALSTLSKNQIHFSVSAQTVDIQSDMKLRPHLMAYPFSPTKDQWADWSSTELWVEVKREPTHDGFPCAVFDPSNLTLEEQYTRSQIIHYMDTHWKSQRREHGFCLQFIGDTSEIRLLRYDPAGIIFTRPLNLTSENDAKRFCKFLCRFGASSRERRGWCTQWRKPNETEQLPASVAQFLGCLTTDVFKIEINNKTYFTGRPRPRHFFRSRATISYNAARQRSDGGFDKCFLKETWAYDAELLESTEGESTRYRDHEGEVYQELDSAGVPNIPKLETDVELSKTVTSKYQDIGGLANLYLKNITMMTQTHRIFIFEGWARQIEEASTIGNMLQAWRDAIVAFREAVKKSKRLHRDISNGNVLVTEGGKGQLADWDQSVEISAPMLVSHGRTGTPIFMAHDLLCNSGMRHQPIHDLESFYHLLTWIVYFYTDNPLLPKELKELTTLFTVAEATPAPLKVLASSKYHEVHGVSVKDTLLRKDDFAPLGSLIVDLREQVIRPIWNEQPNFPWEMAANKMVALADAIIAGNHSRLDKPLRPAQGVHLPWIGSSSSSSAASSGSQPRSKRTRSSQGGRASKLAKLDEDDEPISDDEDGEGDKTIDAGTGEEHKNVQREDMEETSNLFSVGE